MLNMVEEEGTNIAVVSDIHFICFPHNIFLLPLQSCVYVYICVRVCVYAYVCVCTCVCACVCVYACVYVYIYSIWCPP